jgi:hypothetical protein
VLENSLVHGRFWLPYRQEVEVRRTGTWLDYPARGIIRGAWLIGDYELNLGIEPRFFEVVTTPSFEAAAKKLLTEEDRRHLELSLVEDPAAGRLIERTGGFRKFRFARPSRHEGKSGGPA